MLERALDPAEVAPALAAATELAFTRVSRLMGATLEDMTRPASAANVAGRGLGLRLGAARGLALEMAILRKTIEPGSTLGEGEGAPVAEVVQPPMEVVAKVAPTLTLPEWPKGKDLPVREELRSWGLQAGGMVAGYSEHLARGVEKVMKDPDVGSGDLGEWRTDTDKVFGQKLIGSMSPGQLSLVDSTVVSLQ